MLSLGVLTGWPSSLAGSTILTVSFRPYTPRPRGKSLQSSVPVSVGCMDDFLHHSSKYPLQILSGLLNESSLNDHNDGRKETSILLPVPPVIQTPATGRKWRCSCCAPVERMNVGLGRDRSIISSWGCNYSMLQGNWPYSGDVVGDLYSMCVTVGSVPKITGRHKQIEQRRDCSWQGLCTVVSRLLFESVWRLLGNNKQILFSFPGWSYHAVIKSGTGNILRLLTWDQLRAIMAQWCLGISTDAKRSG